MEIKALVLHKDQFALYLISEENEGIFTALLKRYDGSIHDLPPPCITLTRSVRSWKGSSDQQNLVDEIGEIIDINLRSGISLKKTDTGIDE